MATETFHPMLATVEVVLKAVRSGEERRNVIHYRYSGARPTSSELASLCAGVEATIIDAYEDFVCIGTTWYEITANDVEDAGGATASRSITRVAAGGLQVFPGQVSFVLTKRTGLRGRSFRGRFYCIDLPEDFFNGDDFNPAYSAVVNNLAAKLMQFQVSGRFIPSVGSRALGGSTPIQSITYDYISDTQRRRGKGHGI